MTQESFKWEMGINFKAVMGRAMEEVQTTGVAVGLKAADIILTNISNRARELKDDQLCKLLQQLGY